MASKRPPGWREAVDPKSGRKYYYHSVTKQKQWNPPPEWTAEVKSTAKPVETLQEIKELKPQHIQSNSHTQSGLDSHHIAPIASNPHSYSPSLGDTSSKDIPSHSRYLPIEPTRSYPPEVPNKDIDPRYSHAQVGQDSHNIPIRQDYASSSNNINKDTSLDPRYLREPLMEPGLSRRPIEVHPSYPQPDQQVSYVRRSRSRSPIRDSQTHRVTSRSRSPPRYSSDSQSHVQGYSSLEVPRDRSRDPVSRRPSDYHQLDPRPSDPHRTSYSSNPHPSYPHDPRLPPPHKDPYPTSRDRETLDTPRYHTEVVLTHSIPDQNTFTSRHEIIAQAMQIPIEELTDKRSHNKPGWHFSDGEFAFQSLDFRLRWKIDIHAMTFAISYTTRDIILKELDQHIRKYQASRGQLPPGQLFEISDLFGFCSRGIFSFRAAFAYLNKVKTTKMTRKGEEKKAERARVMMNAVWLKYFLEKWGGMANISHLDWKEGADLIIYAEADVHDKLGLDWGRSACCISTGDYYFHGWSGQLGEMPPPESDKTAPLMLFKIYNVATAALTLGRDGSKVVVVTNAGPFQDALRGRFWKDEFVQAFINRFDFECGIRNMSVRFERIEGQTEQLFNDHVSCCGKKEYLTMAKALSKGQQLQHRLARKINSIDLPPLLLPKLLPSDLRG